MNKFKQLWSDLRSSFWFMPSMMTVVGVTFSRILVVLALASSQYKK
jgi:uncharacterized membrane protein